MEPTDFVEILDLMLDDAAAIIHNQRVLAGIHRQLESNILRPFEQDYIYQEHYGQLPSEPRQHMIDGVTIQHRILHQTGTRLADIVGADLLYEIENYKFGLIQYKKVGRNGSIRRDGQQLTTLINNCPEVCFHKRNRPIRKEWLPLRLNGLCGCWYCVIDSGKQKFMHACEAEAIFENLTEVKANEFRSSIDREGFLSMFAQCRLGAVLRQIPRVKPEDYIQPLIERRHLILEVRQSERWSSNE